MKNSNPWLKWLAAIVCLTVVVTLVFLRPTSNKLDEKPTLNEQVERPPTDTNEETLNEIDKEAQARIIFNKIGEANNVAITFYGKVVDQHNQPVPGVKVVMAANKFDKSAGTNLYSGTIPLEMTTDAEGRFTITNQRGRYLTVRSITKEGYVFHPGTSLFPGAQATAFHYSATTTPFVPNNKKAVIFRLWKKGSIEQLTEQGVSSDPVADGRVYSIDLLGGQFSEGSLPNADLHVSIKRPAKITPGVPYEWTFTIDAVNGGIVESQDIYMYEAPSAGYRAGYEYVTPLPPVDYQAAAKWPPPPAWHGDMRKKFYLKSQGGKSYASLEVEIYQGLDDKAGITIKAQINPTGSRNLEAN